MKYLALVLSLIIFPFSNTFATHILSGNIGYECLGNEMYEITIEIERDCFSNGATFDNSINVAIYSAGNLIISLDVNRGNIVEVLPEDYENCMSTALVFCREKTEYVFQVTLPTINESYTITHQRCCWSSIIANIVEPETQGISITTDITPLAQSICNTQEISALPISFLSCPNAFVSIDLPTIDFEGDSLAYNVCLPYEGGGLDGVSSGMDPNGCTGISPNPSCPPPYTELEYAPGFDHNNPFPTVDGIHFMDGTIQFTPTTLGQYLTGLCIAEYRGGELLSRKQIPFAVVSSLDDPNSTEESEIQTWSISHLSSAYIELNAAGTSQSPTVMIFDMHGRQMDTRHSSNGTSTQADITQLPSGIYIIRIESGNDIQLIRFFK